MNVRTIGYTLVIVAAAVALAIGSASNGEATGKKKMAAPPPPQPQPQLCLNDATAPVCGSLKGHKFTYANSCAAWKDGATIVSHKACSVKKAHKAKTMKMKPAKKAEQKKM